MSLGHGLTTVCLLLLSWERGRLARSGSRTAEHTPGGTHAVPGWRVTPGLMALLVLLAGLGLPASVLSTETLVPYRIVDGAISEPLTPVPGDPERGRRIVLDRDGGDCTICHAIPLPQREFHGTIGPALDGIGRRVTAGVLRLRLVDPKVLYPETIMPAYYKIAGLYRVRDRYRARALLTAQQIEDVIAYLLTLIEMP